MKTDDEEIEYGLLLNDTLMMKIVNGVSYSRCFHCGRFFTPDIIDGELQLFCSKECEKADEKYWEEIIKNSDI